MLDSMNGAVIPDAIAQAIGECAREAVVASLDLEETYLLDARLAAKLAFHGVLMQHLQERPIPRDRCGTEAHHVQSRFRHALGAQVFVARDLIVWSQRRRHPICGERGGDQVGEWSDVSLSNVVRG